MTVKKITKKGDSVKLISKSPLDVLMKVPSEGQETIYVQKGVTLKIGEYEFTRIDVGVIRNVNTGDLQANLEELADEIDEALEREIEKL